MISKKRTIKGLQNKQKFIYDIVLNIAATAIPVAVLQLIVYPITANQLGGDEYGLMLTIYSIWMIFSNPLGNVLNNIRLLWNKKYLDSGEVGDFMILYRRWGLIGSVILLVAAYIYYGPSEIVHIGLVVIIGFLIFTKAYLEVGFRIKLNYILIAVNSGIHTVGLLFGLVLFQYTGLWECIYIFGFGFSVFFCLAKTNLLKEAVSKTEFYPKVSADCYSLIIAAVINSLNNYADKVVLFPLIGGTAVSIYYTATILGKIVSMMANPINSVILSYISQWEDSKSNIIKKVFPFTLCVAVVGYGITLLISRPMIELLFPQWVEDVMHYIPITTITIMLNLLISFINPFVMRFCDRRWQIVINAFGAIVYFVVALVLWHFKGLWGFCLGTTIGSLCKLITMIVVYKRRENEEHKSSRATKQ